MTNTMTDGPNGGSTWTGPPNPIEGLRRSESDRWMAGVAGGVARHFDVAPWIVRLIACALAVVGIGIPLYILGWLLLPGDTRASVATERGWNRNTVIAVCVLVVVASLAVLGTDGVSPPWRAVPWIIIALGAFLLIRSATHEPSTVPAVSPVPGPVPGAGGTVLPPPTAPDPTFVETTATPPTIDPTATGETPDVTATMPTVGRPTPPPPPTAPSGFTAPPPAAPPAKRVRRSFLTPLTIFALIVLIGAAVLSGGHGWARPGVVAAISLCVIGVALGLSAFFGRARGLIALGIVVAVPLLIGVAIGPRWDDWQNHTYDPTAAAQLHHTYDRGIGRTVLDLRDVPLPAGHVTRVHVDQVIGQVVLWLPADARTHLTGHVSFGEIAYDSRPDHNGGTDVRTDRTLTTGDGAARLDLDVDLSAGQISIHDHSAHGGNR
jgi:phage shock protein PspC (stress-responsive transcriptional regulator)